MRGSPLNPYPSRYPFHPGGRLRDEVFYDGLTTFWLVADDQRAANDAVQEVASLEGPFEDYINVQLVSGTITDTSDGPWFKPDPDGDVECWEVDAQ